MAGKEVGEGPMTILAKGRAFTSYCVISDSNNNFYIVLNLSFAQICNITVTEDKRHIKSVGWWWVGVEGSHTILKNLS